MVDAKQNGASQAFPTMPPMMLMENGAKRVLAEGLTKREAMAMAAMQGMLATGRQFAPKVTAEAVEMADALLAELAKGGA